MSFRKSPYLIFNKDYSITNLLTDKRYYFAGRENSKIFETIKDIPVKINDFESRELKLDIDFLLDKKMIFSDSLDPFMFTFIRYASIEISNVCNNRCKFCPVSVYSLPAKWMDEVLFRTIVSRLTELPDIRWVSLNHYNEPLLDANIADKIVMLGQNGMKVRLFSNGKNLKPCFFTQDVFDSLDRLVLNIPSTDPEKYCTLTGTPMPKTFIKNIKEVLSMGINTEICVNGDVEQAAVEKEQIDVCFDIASKNHCNSYVNVTNSRLGLIVNEHVNEKGKASVKGFSLGGCRRFFENISIGVSGEVFLCCQDYFKYFSFGNLKNQKISEILHTDAYLQMKKKICGEIQAEDDFICRYCNEIIKWK